jgi:hypothetical protein
MIAFNDYDFGKLVAVNVGPLYKGSNISQTSPIGNISQMNQDITLG